MHKKDHNLALKHLGLDLDLKEVSDGGKFEGYASTVGNVDRGGDVVMAGAFANSLAKWKAKGKMPKMLWQHDPGKVVGVWDDMTEDGKGLYVKGRVLTDLQLGKELHTLMRHGAVDSMSIGYRTVDAEYEGSNAEVRKLKELELWEVSLVTFPMNEEAAITNVKHLAHKGEVERILREAGVPGAFAKLVALHGFDEAKRLVEGRRAADDTGDLQAALAALHDNLTKRNGVIQK